MSKKMMKRSLALGALMAFVITGSAMAADNLFGGEDLSYATKLPEKTTFELEKTTGSFDEVISGTYIGINTSTTHLHNQTQIIDFKETSTVLGGDIEVAEGVYAGSKIAGGYPDGGNHPKVILNLNTDKTNLTINGGSYGITTSDDGFRKILSAGDFLKDRGTNYGNVVSITSNVKDANLTINGGDFKSVIFGGSVIGFYTYDLVQLEANVEKTTINLNGGTYESPIVAGGGVYNTWSANSNDKTADREKFAKSNVGEAYLNIGNKVTVGDVYAGGLEGVNKGASNLSTEPIATVKKSVINLNDATVSNVYGYGVNAYRENGNWSYSVDKDDVVNTDLTLTNATVKGTVDLPQGTLTLNGINNVENVIIGEKVTNVKVDSAALEEGSSLTGDGTGSLIVEGEKTTKLTITGITAGTYNIASGYATNEANKFVFDQKDELLDAKAVYDEQNKIYKVEVTAKSAGEIADKLETSESTGNFVENIISGGNDEATQFLDKLMGNSAGNNAVINDTLNAVQKMAEAGGNSATAANIVKNVTGVTNDRLSFNCGHSAPHKGGHGVGLFEEGSGADIWVEYVHGKDEVEDMPSTAGATSYEGQYNGIVMGVDFKKVGKFQSGIAFNYGEGDTNSVGSATRTHSDYDFWGVGYYGNIHNDDSNVIFDINYAQTDSDVTQSNPATTLEASPETTTWSAGVKLEKLYQNENVQIVPYTGLRYMSIDSDDYATKGKGFMYSMERQDIWLLPLGVSIKQEVVNDNGWTVSPRVDLSYIWAFGDTNSNMEVKSGNGITPIGYDVMDDGSFLGLVGIEAHKGQWGYGIAYSYQKGDHSESKKWYVDVNYSF